MTKLVNQTPGAMTGSTTGSTTGAAATQWAAFGLLAALGGAAVTLGVVRHQERAAVSGQAVALATPPGAQGPEQPLPPPPMVSGDPPAPAGPPAEQPVEQGELPPLPPPPLVGGGLPIEEPPYQTLTEEPPPPQDEDMPPIPFAGAVWVGGHWEWDNGWSWVAGRWLAPPQPGYAYNPPYYEDRGGVVLFIRGYWRRPGALFVPPPLDAASAVGMRAAVGGLGPVSLPGAGITQQPAPGAPPPPRQQVPAGQRPKFEVERPHQDLPQRPEQEARQPKADVDRRAQEQQLQQAQEQRAEQLRQQQQAESEARQRAEAEHRREVEEAREAAESQRHHQPAAPRGKR